ncbi:complement resistance protein TraT, partial [Methylocystis sp. NLS-7]|nr:complement resistance protein TraT [Methylocystis suflitae]
LPFEAAPVFAPQGIVGDALGAIGAPLGGFIGGRFGNAGLGQTIGGTVGGLAQRFLPFEAAPVFAPQGIVGDALGAIGAPLGGFIGGRFGNAGLGQTIGGTVGGLAQRFLPFEAEPVFVPQGFIGDALGAVGGRVGNWIGGRFGNAGAGQTVGNVVGGLAQRFLPFEAGPQAGTYYVPQTAAPGFAPQGIVGDALGAIGAPLGGFIGGRFGNAGLGQTIGGTVGGLAQRFLPFDAAPQPVYYVPQMQAPMYG